MDNFEALIKDSLRERVAVDPRQQMRETKAKITAKLLKEQSNFPLWTLIPILTFFALAVLFFNIFNFATPQKQEIDQLISELDTTVSELEKFDTAFAETDSEIEILLEY